VVFKILKECGFVGEGNELMHQRLDEKLHQVIGKKSDDLRLFLGNG